MKSIPSNVLNLRQSATNSVKSVKTEIEIVLEGAKRSSSSSFNSVIHCNYLWKFTCCMQYWFLGNSFLVTIRIILSNKFSFTSCSRSSSSFLTLAVFKSNWSFIIITISGWEKYYVWVFNKWKHFLDFLLYAWCPHVQIKIPFYTGSTSWKMKKKAHKKSL